MPLNTSQGRSNNIRMPFLNIVRINLIFNLI
jgi:hypothetical protein